MEGGVVEVDPSVKKKNKRVRTVAADGRKRAGAVENEVFKNSVKDSKRCQIGNFPLKSLEPRAFGQYWGWYPHLKTNGTSSKIIRQFKPLPRDNDVDKRIYLCHVVDNPKPAGFSPTGFAYVDLLAQSTLSESHILIQMSFKCSDTTQGEMFVLIL